MPAGANAIPVDIFHSKSNAAAMQQLVDNALDANMNMVRIWGGGMYYRDEFYDYTDRAGLLVWQEAMFACSLYPANSAFLADVRTIPARFSPSAFRLEEQQILARQMATVSGGGGWSSVSGLAGLGCARFMEGATSWDFQVAYAAT